MSPINYQRHNEEVKAVWEAYRSGKPVRVPVLLSGNSRIWVLDPALNKQGLTWEEFVSDPNVMFETQLKFRHHWANSYPQDIEMGIPEGGWSVGVEFHNVVEEAWFGSPIIYPENQVSASQPAFAGNRKWEAFEKGIPGPFDGIFARMKEFHEHFLEKARHFEFYSKPVSVMPPSAVGTDGPLTIANGVRGPEIMEDILNDEEYYHRLMDFITEAVIRRIKAWREVLGLDLRPKSGGFADDAVQFLSVKTYREKVLPYHRRILSELWGEGPHSMHLCGNVQRLLPVIVKELNIHSFDTGYPIRWETLRDEIGDEVEILGGVRVGDLISCTSAEIYARSQAILESGIMRGGKFILKEANNLAPCTPIENVAAMYEAAKTFGRY
jgi:hypothetical protein